jgi:asparagine synthase (glutamine-hydrolysing)
MCGIAGIIRFSGETNHEVEIRRMTDVMHHRGPDGSGHVNRGQVSLGHRRLSILDLTDAGAQPMVNDSNDVWITYNGEIYNHWDIRKELDVSAYEYRSRSDTETILVSYERWGSDCFYKLNGMFALGILDERRRRLVLARDRFGVKPLYYYFDGKIFLFASEIKAILTHPEVQKSVCHQALDEYLTFQNILTDRTLFEGIKLLPAGTTLTLDLTLREPKPVLEQFWDYRFPDKPLDISFEEAAEETHRLFVQAVERQLQSDVPVASYLSGGLDSGSITAIARKKSGRMLTFTGGFDLSSASGLELGFDERKASEYLSNLLKTEHYEMVLHAGDMEHVMPELIWHLEDLRVGQCYPNYYIARLASKFGKVCLSGCGGDELFGGYPWRYYRGAESKNRESYFQNYYSFWQRLVPDGDKVRLFRPEINANINEQSSFDTFRNVFKTFEHSLDSPESYVDGSLYFEFKTFLNGLLLVEDKMSMAHSLETRVPFLDNDLVDFASQLPASYKIKDLFNINVIDEHSAAKRYHHSVQTGDGKLVLRRALEKVLPAEVTNRAKQGFSAPDATWFRGESVDYVNHLLRNPKARIHEFIEPNYITHVLEEHTSGRQNKRLLIWSFLSLEHWLKNFF